MKGQGTVPNLIQGKKERCLVSLKDEMMKGETLKMVPEQDRSSSGMRCRVQGSKDRQRIKQRGAKQRKPAEKTIK